MLPMYGVFKYGTARGSFAKYNSLESGNFPYNRILSYVELRQLAKDHRSVMTAKGEQTSNPGVPSYEYYAGRLAFILGLRDPKHTVYMEEQTNSSLMYCPMCWTLVEETSWSDERDVCVKHYMTPSMLSRSFPLILHAQKSKISRS